ncbi:diguanylate cyclase [Halomonas sp.]|uniref:diguanylate cyclase n=1 Tax=Halomonas sp. TaxID=1486246 RepID=UPI00260F85B0|nr:diguanylate cyclase [Halomonas sp.]
MAERIRLAVEAHHFPDHDHQRVPVTTSIGVARLGERETPQQALERADAALYRSKAQGRNRVTHAA